MDTLYGFSVYLEPSYLFKGLKNSWDFKDIKFSIKENKIEVGFNHSNQEEQARNLVNLYIDFWAYGHEKNLATQFDHSWKLKEGAKLHQQHLDSKANTVPRVLTHTLLRGLTYHVSKKIDSSSFTNLVEDVHKILENESLAKVFKYFNEEVLDNERPLPGVYKIIEELSHSLGKIYGINKKENQIGKLASIAGETKSYIKDIIQTTQPVRHARTKATRKLTDKECVARTKILTEVYIKHLKSLKNK